MSVFGDEKNTIDKRNMVQAEYSNPEESSNGGEGIMAMNGGGEATRESAKKSPEK